ncbi:MAG: sugar ABC transporter permease [Anaerolineae bacterium]|uniref:carbohydrate ABC transporter permease n=1 Tax=Candidatus Amarolinea dominans TaxID=3140696 RepID=UPI0031374525|nr:sugar ABC transporter permease [Anaerolineae bacterium]
MKNTSPSPLAWRRPASLASSSSSFRSPFRSYVSLWEWPLLRPGAKFLGLGNYARLLQTPDFWHALRVTLLYAAGVVGLGTPLALMLALALHQVRRGQALYRTAIFLPVAITTVVAAIFWRWLYQPYAGPLALLWQVLGWRPIAWLNDVALPR